MGDSGGGNICSGTGFELAKKNEGDLIKLQILQIPQTCNYPFLGDKKNFSNKEEESFGGPAVAGYYMMMASDNPGKLFAPGGNVDPNIFPSHNKDELVKKAPMTIVMSTEWDFLANCARFDRDLY